MRRYRLTSLGTALALLGLAGGSAAAGETDREAIGFGFCDASFPSVFARFGASPFTAYRAPGGSDWYLDPANVGEVR